MEPTARRGHIVVFGLFLSTTLYLGWYAGPGPDVLRTIDGLEDFENLAPIPIVFPGMLDTSFSRTSYLGPGELQRSSLRVGAASMALIQFAGVVRGLYNNRIIRNVLCDHRPCPNNCPITNHTALSNMSTRRNRRPVAYNSRRVHKGSGRHFR